MHPFTETDILIPDKAEMEKWAVIACDQFTSQPDYWEKVEKTVGTASSALSMIFPEVWLGKDRSARIQGIQRAMEEALAESLFTRYEHAFVYVERTLKNGDIRPGIVGAVDLEAYDYRPSASSQIRATERTVVERIPPRMEIRKGARLELSHVLLLMSDAKRDVIEPMADIKDSLPRLYDFDLMQGGGHITGWLVQGEAAEQLRQRIHAYEARMAEAQPGTGEAALLYAVGDGNHSLATAKECYEALKKENPDKDLSAHPARFAMVELGNVYDDSLQFEPIHRIIRATDPEALLADLKAACGGENGTEIGWCVKDCRGTVSLACDGKLPVAVLQDFLDEWLKSHPGEIDYIHGERALEMLAKEEGAIGFLLPAMDKAELFPGIIKGGVLPRKTFSMGHAEEKRYYLEARLISE